MSSRISIIMSMIVTNAKLVDPIHKWTTDDSKGKSKEALYSSVRVSFLEYGIATRNNNDIRAKIQNFRDKFQDTYKFLHNTGEGIKETTFSDDVSEANIESIIQGDFQSSMTFATGKLLRIA
ncbi:hypothetical protein F4703DRAFT_1796038 [Phycomyces blakesleeanus]